MIIEKIIYDLLEDGSFRRYALHGEFVEKWEKWRKDHPEYRQEMELASMVMENLYQENKNIIHDLKEKDVKNKIKKSIFKAIDTNSSHSRFTIWKVAATLLILCTFIPVVWFVQNKFSTPETAPHVVNVPKVVKLNPSGVKSIITFSDGSKAYLNSESKIVYSQVFSEDLREVELVGEAYFEINEDENRPFIIQVGDLEIKVLGTAFNVDAYPENLFVNVALVSGKVLVNIPTGGNVELLPSEMLKYRLAGNETHKIVPFISEEIIGWKDGILSFREESVKDIFEKLERWYGVEIIYDKRNPVFSKWIFTGKFEKRSLEYILNTMNYEDIFEFKIENSKIIIK
jgi:transmembrane sensor